MLCPDDFCDELKLIKNNEIRDFVYHCLEQAPVYFWTNPSSSGGKYHNATNNGDGGLVRHSRATAMFGADFARMYSMSQADTDAVVAACILHDLCKYGLPGGKYTTPDHCYTSAKYVNGLAQQYEKAIPMLKEILGGIAWHNGQWTKRLNGQTVKNFPTEYSKIEEIVHMADYASSRSYVSINKFDSTVAIG